ncbi:hypothetical protein EVAR_68201_1 [Eumeta japonica]|uniref:Uncharacterized protein n=1 Tax=Eumeta variegata TaxID=151549 RepID=A0A4C2A102_EUMVA|nr:hypothetical protein EVAR_68201_1 [Eumeta japonica]
MTSECAILRCGPAAGSDHKGPYEKEERNNVEKKIVKCLPDCDHYDYPLEVAMGILSNRSMTSGLTYLKDVDLQNHSLVNVFLTISCVDKNSLRLVGRLWKGNEGYKVYTSNRRELKVTKLYVNGVARRNRVEDVRGEATAAKAQKINEQVSPPSYDTTIRY